MRERAVIAANLLVALVSVVPAARAASSCYTQTCSSACGSSWSGFSTLLDGGDYPDDADTPVAFVDPDDGSRQRLIATKEGKIWVWDGATGSILPTPYLDLAAAVDDAFNERGLLALAVDPEFAATGQLYVLYTRDSAVAAERGDVVLERYSRLTAQTADPASAETILLLEHSSNDNHNGGWLAFGPDRMLYVSLGDGGGSCDDDAPGSPHGQGISSLLGKLLRLDVRGEDPGATAPECGEGAGAYGVPLGNPFAGETAGCGEIWAFGLRNPWRFSFDRLTGDLWIGDVGQGDWEEIDFLAADYYPLAPDGAINFGWKCREGCESPASNCGSTGCPAEIDDPSPLACDYPKDLDPGAGEILYWDPVLCHDNRNFGGSDWQAIVGGYRYRGPGMPELFGSYFYGDAYCDQIWRSTAIVAGDPAATTAACWHGLPDNSFLYSFAEDAQGELYLLHADGRIVCLHQEGGGCPWADGSRIFADGVERGDTSAWSATGDEP